jgi:hypothetical protein
MNYEPPTPRGGYRRTPKPQRSLASKIGRIGSASSSVSKRGKRSNPTTLKRTKSKDRSKEA